jgi:metal-responsive CopG/Arc/MetJ family transcriptional regulator
VDLADLEEGNIKQSGVGLRAGEIKALDAIGAELGGVARNALIRYAVRLLIHEYRAGRLDLAGDVEAPPPPKKRLKPFGQE